MANNAGNKTKTVSKPAEQVSTPPLYKVLMHNDDYTTMEFVIEVLRNIFHKPATEAEKIMLTIHFQGFGDCGTFPYAIAETKADQVRLRARKSGFPLRCSLEET